LIIFKKKDVANDLEPGSMSVTLLASWVRSYGNDKLRVG